MGMFTVSSPEPLPPRVDPHAEVLHWTRHVSAFALAEEVSCAIDLPVGLVRDALSRVPANMLTLLDSPQGWTALSAYVAGELGCYPPDYVPAVH